MTAEPEGRVYRLAARDGAGWLLGLAGPQCAALAGAVAAAGILLNAGAPAPLVLLPLAAGTGFAFARVGASPLHEWLPVHAIWLVRRLTGRTTWHARLPLLPAAGAGQPDLPPCLADLSIGEAPAAGWAARRLAGIAVVHHRRAGLASATLRVRGREFALLDRAEQERMLTGWGEALDGLCADRSPVAFLRWSEWASPAGLEDQLAYLDEHRAAPETDPAVAAYRELLDEAGTMATGHEVLVTVTVDGRRVRTPGRRHGTGPSGDATDTLVEELRLLTGRLEAAGLTVDPPLSPAELAAALRLRFDPAARHAIAARRRSLAELAGVSLHNAGPLTTVEERTHVRTDGALHRGFLISEWPRLDVAPGWLEPLLLHPGGVRTLSLTHFPVPPTRSARQVKRDSTKLASDAELREHKGFRVGAGHRRAEAAVAEREAELVAGFGEHEYVGLLCITAADLDTLEVSCADYQQAAAQAGLELRPLDGRHDLALAATLPLGCELPTRRLP